MSTPSHASPASAVLSTASLSGGAPASVPNLEPMLAAVEKHLESLGDALRARDARAIDHESTELHRALVRALDGFTAAAKHGPVRGDLRDRLAQASGKVVVHRECLARATAALDRAVDALMPRDGGGGVYNAQGSTRSALPQGGVIA